MRLGCVLFFLAAALSMFLASYLQLKLPLPACQAGIAPYALWVVSSLVFFSKPASLMVSRMLAGIPFVDWMLLLPIAMVPDFGNWHSPLLSVCVSFPPVAFTCALALQRRSPAT